MNIPKGLLFLQKSSIIDVRLGSENIEVFKEKLGWSKLSRLLQRIAFSCSVFNIINITSYEIYNFIKNKMHDTLSLLY